MNTELSFITRDSAMESLAKQFVDMMNEELRMKGTSYFRILSVLSDEILDEIQKGYMASGWKVEIKDMIDIETMCSHRILAFT